MPNPVSRLLHHASWQAEKLFKARGWLCTMVWCTETKDGRRQMFEIACEAVRCRRRARHSRRVSPFNHFCSEDWRQHRGTLPPSAVAAWVMP
jgi:hypothetical protein